MTAKCCAGVRGDEAKRIADNRHHRKLKWLTATAQSRAEQNDRYQIAVNASKNKIIK